MQIIEFAWVRRDEVLKAVEKLARRASKLGVSFTAIVGNEVTRTKHETTEVAPGEFRPTGRVLEWGQLALEDAEIALSGWSLLGVLSPLPASEAGTETVLFPSAVPGKQLPTDVREWTQRCDHCGTIRRRTETFIVQHEDGTVKQVGRNCIRDFLGHDADRFLSNFGFWNTVAGTLDEDELGYGSSHAPVAYTILPILAATAAVVRTRGWVSAGAARAYAEQSGGVRGIVPTKDIVAEYLWGTAKSAKALRAEIGPVLAEDEAAAEAAVAYWTEEQGSSDYSQNAQMIVRAGRCIPRAFGLAVSLVPVTQNAAAKRALEASTVDSQHVGVVGERSQFEVEVIGRRFIESQYGTKCLVTLRDRAGNLIKWWATGSDSFLPKEQSGEFVTVAGTVKEHGEFKGRKETTLSRVALPPAPKARKAKGAK